jgi:hypothetical protein
MQTVHGTEGHMAVYGPVWHTQNIIKMICFKMISFKMKKAKKNNTTLWEQFHNIIDQS